MLINFGVAVEKNIRYLYRLNEILFKTRKNLYDNTEQIKNVITFLYIPHIKKYILIYNNAILIYSKMLISSFTINHLQ